MRSQIRKLAGGRPATRLQGERRLQGGHESARVLTKESCTGSELRGSVARPHFSDETTRQDARGGKSAPLPCSLRLSHRISVGRGTLKRRDCLLERFAQNPTLAIGNGVEPVDGLCARFDVELDISACSVPPRLPHYRFLLRFSRRSRSGHGFGTRRGRFPAHKTGSL